MRTLGNPGARNASDLGDPDPAVRALLSEAGDADSYTRAVAALCGARLLLPVVATGREEPGEPAELAAVMMTSATGRTGLLAFTGLDALVAWNPQARPVPCTLDDVAATAVETGSAAVLVDLAGPSPLVIEHQLIVELAAGRRLVELEDGGFGWLSAVTGVDVPPERSPVTLVPVRPAEAGPQEES